MEPKVFCIGFHKTGTSSLAKALETLGYNLCRRIKNIESKMEGESVLECLSNNSPDAILKAAKNFNAFADNPWVLLFKEVDKEFPGSKFILSIRSEEEWLKSVLSYFQSYETEIRKLIYGKASPLGNEQIYLERYRRHNQEVREYFKHRPDDLLLLRSEQLDWEDLCTFLGKEIPDIAFPYENQRRANRVGELAYLPKKRLSLARLANFVRLGSRRKKLFLEAWFTLSFSRIMIFFMPFRKLANYLGETTNESTNDLSKQELSKVKEIGREIKKASLYTPFRSLCFEQALTVKLMLKKRKIPATIYLGVAKEEDTKLHAHAWTRAGNYIVSGKREKDLFKVVSSFS